MAILSEELKKRLANMGPKYYRAAGSPRIQYPDGTLNPEILAVAKRESVAEFVYVGECSSQEEREAKIHKKLSE